MTDELQRWIMIALLVVLVCVGVGMNRRLTQVNSLLAAVSSHLVAIETAVKALPK